MVAAASTKAPATPGRRSPEQCKDGSCIHYVSSQAAGALTSGGGESAQPSDQQHPILANAVNQTAKAEKAVSKSGSVQPDEARATGSRSIDITMMC